MRALRAGAETCFGCGARPSRRTRYHQRMPLAVDPRAPRLHRGIGTAGALGANIIDMVGVGPFITLPLIVSAMGGPQAMLGWLLGAALSLLDGFTWSELGTAHPEAGGSYAYLKASFPPRAGRGLSFLYAWQVLFSAPLSIASGCIGFAQYAGWFLPGTSHAVLTGIAMIACLLCTVLLLQPIRRVGAVTKVLGVAVLLTVVAVIAVGFSHFSAARAFSFPPGAFHIDGAFFLGLGGGLLISAYDYWGYYNVCFLGAEVKEPQRTIPRAVLGSIAIVGTLYLLMNTAVLGVLPWQTLASETAGARQYTIAVFAQQAFATHTWAHSAGSMAVVLIALASLASVYALLLGYSRIPFAAAEDSNFPAIFARLHPKNHVPTIALLTLSAVTVLCCLFRLQEVIASLVVVRIVFQFLLQGVAVMLPRHRAARQLAGSFRMPLYPLPTLLAMCGFVYILLSRPRLLVELRPVGFVLVSGLVIYAIRSWKESRVH